MLFHFKSKTCEELSKKVNIFSYQSIIHLVNLNRKFRSFVFSLLF